MNLDASHTTCAPYEGSQILFTKFHKLKDVYCFFVLSVYRPYVPLSEPAHAFLSTVYKETALFLQNY